MSPFPDPRSYGRHAVQDGYLVQKGGQGRLSLFYFLCENWSMDVKNVSEVIRFRAEKMQKINLFESSRMFCDVYCLEPGQQQALHDHQGNDKMYFVLEGEGSFTVGEETRILQQGEITCAWSGEPHGVENTSASRLICLVFMAPHPQADKFSS